MNPRQKLIVVAIAVPVIGVIAYAATRDGSETPPPVAPVAAPGSQAGATPAQAGNGGAAPVATPAQAGNNGAPTITDGHGKGNRKTLDEMKAQARTRLSKIEAMTDEEYATLRSHRLRLPATLAEYKAQKRVQENRILAMTQEQYDAEMRQGNGKGGAKGKGGADRAAHPKGQGHRGPRNGGARAERNTGAGADAAGDNSADDTQ